MDELPRSFEEYERSLSIPREGEVPELSPEMVERVTRVCFARHDPGPADVLFVFGTAQGDWEGMARLVNEGHVGRVVVAGLIGRLYYSHGVPIAHTMRERLLEAGVPADRIEVQDRSTHTREDVEFSLPLLEGARSILFFAKAHHSGRCQLTLRRFLPETPLRAMTMPAWYGDVVVEERSWTQHTVSRARVWGEYTRILTYSERGDIASPEL